MVSSSKNLELVDDGKMPQVMVKERNETVDLLHQADDKLKKVLEFYAPARKSTGSTSSKASSSRRSKTSTVKPKQPPPTQPLIRVEQ